MLVACRRNGLTALIPLALFCLILPVPALSALVAGQDKNERKHKHTDTDSMKPKGSAAFTKRATELLRTTIDQYNHTINSYELRYADDPFNPNSTKITNNVPWRDNNGNLLENGRGGKISKIGRNWYWIGSQPSKKGNWFNGGTIYIYSSTSLGSNSWEFVRKIEMPDNQTSSNCQIAQHPRLKTIHIFCRRKLYKLKDGGGIKDGVFERTNNEAEPRPLPGSQMNWGNQNMFQQGNQMYAAVSRCKLRNGSCIGKRKAFIYRLNASWTNFSKKKNKLVAKWDWDNREAFHLVRRNGWWYIFASEAVGWRQSRTWYRRARTLEDLAKRTDRQVKMHPRNTQNIKSMGTQFRFIQKIGSGKWLFGGTRHPTEDPDNFDPKYGTHVVTPMRFKRGVPHVYWKETFSWNAYRYNSGDRDEHKVDWYGPAP